MITILSFTEYMLKLINTMTDVLSESEIIRKGLNFDLEAHVTLVLLSMFKEQ